MLPTRLFSPFFGCFVVCVCCSLICSSPFFGYFVFVCVACPSVFPWFLCFVCVRAFVRACFLARVSFEHVQGLHLPDGRDAHERRATHSSAVRSAPGLRRVRQRVRSSHELRGHGKRARARKVQYRTPVHKLETENLSQAGFLIFGGGVFYTNFSVTAPEFLKLVYMGLSFFLPCFLS